MAGRADATQRNNYELVQRRLGQFQQRAADSSVRPIVSQRSLRLALVGCGQISHAHLAGIQAICRGFVEVTVLIDPERDRAEKLAELVVTGGGTAPAIFESLDEAIMAEGVAKLEDADNLPLFEAVDVMLPHQLHVPITLQCFATKKHVLLEKPLASTLAGAESILAAADRAARNDGLVFMVAENSQYWPEVRATVDLIEGGAIGEILTAKAYFNMRKSEAVYAENGKFRGANGEDSNKPWRYDLAVAGGGIVIDGGAHWIRPMRMFMGEVHSVVGVTSRLLEQMEGESFAQALLRFQSGKVGFFEAMAGPTLHLGVYEHKLTIVIHMFTNVSGRQGWRVTGTEGEILVTGFRDEFDESLSDPHRVTLFNADNPEGLDCSPPTPVAGITGYPASFGYEILDFAKCILVGSTPAKPVAADKNAPRTQAEHSLGEMKTALALYRSAETGAWEPVWEQPAHASNASKL